MRGATTKISARAGTASARMQEREAEEEEEERPASVFGPTVEKRRVLSRVRRGALYLSHRRVRAEPGPNVPQTEFAARNTRAERTPLTVTKNRRCS